MLHKVNAPLVRTIDGLQSIFWLLDVSDDALIPIEKNEMELDVR